MENRNENAFAKNDTAANNEISKYEELTTINAAHGISLTKHRETGKIAVKKQLTVYNKSIYVSLQYHPVMGTPKILALEETQDQLTVIEEYISGTPMNELIANHTLTASKIRSYIIDLCSILEELHSRKPPMIHRDIKPSNLIVTTYDKIVLLDFNAAKWYTPEDITDTVLLGTQGFAAPEQYGFGCSAPQTDLYAVGILLREMMLSLPEPTKEFNPIIWKCTQMDPNLRYQTATALKAALTGETSTENRTKKPLFGKYTLPGYRTRTPYKMVLATFGYIVLLWLCATIELKDTTGLQLWWERLISLAMMLSMIFGCSNYCSIQNLIPLCSSKHRIIRILGIILLDFLLIFILGFVMVLVEDIFFPT